MASEPGYVLLPRAQADIEQIVRYLADDLASPQATKHFLDEFDKGISATCGNPEMHPLSKIPEVAARGYRTMPVMRYVVLHTVRDDRVVIAHVFHGMQDYARYA